MLSERTETLLLLVVFFLLLHLTVNVLRKNKDSEIPLNFTRQFIYSSILFSFASIWDELPFYGSEQYITSLLLIAGGIFTVAAVGDLLTTLLYRVLRIEERIESNEKTFHSLNAAQSVPKSHSIFPFSNLNRYWNRLFKN